MKAFVWKRITKVSDNYHEEGGLMIIAESIDRAREIAKTESQEKMLGHEKEPDFIFESSYPEEVVAFPDAGCC